MRKDPSHETLLFNIQLQMRERDPASRVDVEYPYQKLDNLGQLVEHFEKPPQFDVKFIYNKSRKTVSFKIFAVRLDNIDEQYEIEIHGSKKIKSVMKQFGNEYMSIVDNLRIMGDALVLLNPIKNPALRNASRDRSASPDGIALGDSQMNMSSIHPNNTTYTNNMMENSLNTDPLDSLVVRQKQTAEPTID